MNIIFNLQSIENKIYINNKNSMLTKCILTPDPRLYHSMSNEYINPHFGTCISSMITREFLDKHGKKFNSTVKGQIKYYNSDKNPFNTPFFSDKSKNYKKIYTDPMGNTSIQHIHVPNKKHNPISDNEYDIKGEYCLSWIKDSQFHREDLLSRKMSTINKKIRQ